MPAYLVTCLKSECAPPRDVAVARPREEVVERRTMDGGEIAGELRVRKGHSIVDSGLRTAWPGAVPDPVCLSAEIRVSTEEHAPALAPAVVERRSIDRGEPPSNAHGRPPGTRLVAVLHGTSQHAGDPTVLGEKPSAELEFVRGRSHSSTAFPFTSLVQRAWSYTTARKGYTTRCIFLHNCS